MTYKPSEADWSREMRGNTLITTVDLRSVVVISTRRDADKANDFVTTLGKVGPPMGIGVDRRAFDMITLDNDRTDNFIKSIMSKVNEDTQMVSRPRHCLWIVM